MGSSYPRHVMPAKNNRTDTPHKHSLGAKSFQLYGLMMLCSLFVCAFVQKNLSSIFNLPLDSAALLEQGTLVLLGVGILVASSQLFDAWFPSFRLHKEQTHRLIGPLNLFSAVLLSLVAAAGEELLFRGALQPFLGLGLSSVLIGFLHFSPQGTFTAWSVYGLMTAMLLGVIFEHTKSLVPGFTVHTIVNLNFLMKHYFAMKRLNNGRNVAGKDIQ
ncbi:MAG: CPBP family intramembrane metalloprotease [Deltaproteobacteria bacterium]|nr:CPBP family intramembrane metalloprotease [Deltaproteobacteria bacterium]